MFMLKSWTASLLLTVSTIQDQVFDCSLYQAWKLKNQITSTTFNVSLFKVLEDEHNLLRSLKAVVIEMFLIMITLEIFKNSEIFFLWSQIC